MTDRAISAEELLETLEKQAAEISRLREELARGAHLIAYFSAGECHLDRLREWAARQVPTKATP